MLHDELPKFPALADLLSRRSPNHVSAIIAEENAASRLLLEAHQLGDSPSEKGKSPVIEDSVLKLVKLFLKAAYEDTAEIENIVTFRIKRFAILKLFSTGIVLLASAGLIFTLFGESRLASLVIGCIIFVSSFVGTILTYLEDVYGGSYSLQKLNFTMNAYAPRLKSIDHKYMLSYECNQSETAEQALIELEALSKEIATTRSQLRLPIKASSPIE